MPGAARVPLPCKHARPPYRSRPIPKARPLPFWNTRRDPRPRPCSFRPDLPEGNATGGNLFGVWSPQTRARLTIQAMAPRYVSGVGRVSYCDAGQRPRLYGGSAASSDLPILTFGSDNEDYLRLASVAITSVEVHGSASLPTSPGDAAVTKTRPGVAATYASSLTLRDFHVYNTFGTYAGSGLEVWDTTLTWRCSG